MKKIKIDSFTNYKFLAEPRFSPDGRRLCFRVTAADQEENEYNSRLWIYDFEGEPGKELFQLTTGDKDGSFAWLDEEKIIFTSEREEKDEERLLPRTEFYLINVTGGEAQHFLNISQKVQNFKADGRGGLIFTASKDLRERDEEKLKEDKDIEVLEEIPFWANGKGFTDHYRNHLYRLDLETEEISELIGGKHNIENFTLAENGSRVAVSLKYFQDKADTVSNIYLYNLEDKGLTQLTDREWAVASLDFQDNEHLVFAANEMEDIGLNSNPDLFRLNIISGEIEQLTHKLDRSLWTSVGNDCRYGKGQTSTCEAGKYYFLSTEEYNTYLNCLNLEDSGYKVERIIVRQGTVDMFDVSRDRIVFVGFRDNKLQELYLFQQGEERQLSSFNRETLADKTTVTPEYFQVEASDGCQLDAWLMKPADYQPGEKYPAVLEIHGGPKTVYGTIFFHEFQVLAAAGYAVIFSNPRGSDGRGNEFADIRSAYGSRDYQDLMEVTDAALESFDFIDKDKLGVTGGSYGCYMTNWTIGQTDRFQAAVSHRSIASWISMFGTTDIGYYFVEDQYQGATPWSGMEKLWEGSPLKYADRVSTPTLFIHSEEDYRCWLTEGLQMFTALKYHDVESRLCLFKGENHELSRSGRPKSRIRRLKEMLDWFDKYLK